MEDNLDELLKQEKENRENNNYYPCLLTCLKILDEIQSKNESIKFDIISKLFLYLNQSNYVKISLMYSLIQNSSFINNKTSKRKYYQLLIDSFTQGIDQEYQQEINKIIKLHKKSELNNYVDLDKYISKIYLEISKSNIPFEPMNTSINGESSIINLAFKPPNLIDDSNTQNKGQTSFEEINSENNADITSTVQDTYSNINNDNKKISEIKNVLKKYIPNNKLPMIIMCVSANLNSNQFLNLINENFEKNNFYNICTLKNTERDNIKVYEYHSKNCINNLFSKVSCKNKNSIPQFQVMSILKRDENNFDMGINSYLNDIYERKISIKTIRGNEKKVIKIIIKFLKNYCLNVEKIKIIKQSKCFLKYNLDETLKTIINNQQNKKYKKIYSSLSTKDETEKNLNSKNTSDNILIDSSLVEETNNSASKYYEIYKIFSKKQYGLGKTISDFIENFKKDYNFSDKENINVNKIDTKKAMMKIVNVFEESTNTLNSTFNYNDQNLKDKSSFFAKASEQFILNKIYPILYNIYNIKYKNENEIYLQKIKEINKKCTINEICEKIGIKKKFRGKENIPFKYVIDKINKIYFEKSIKQKFEAMTQASLELRNCILEYTNCKFELDSMDDELPIIIYIATQLKVNNLFAELYMIDDYIKCSLRDNLVQNKMVTNLLSSLFYISNEWKMDN